MACESWTDTHVVIPDWQRLYRRSERGGWLVSMRRQIALTHRYGTIVADPTAMFHHLKFISAVSLYGATWVVFCAGRLDQWNEAEVRGGLRGKRS